MKQPIQLAFALCLVAGCLQAQSKAEQAKVLFEQKKYEQVKELLSLIDEEDTAYPVAQYYLGRVAMEEKNFENAVDYFEEATDGKPNEGDYFNWLGDAYAAVGSKANIFKQMSVGPKALRSWEKAAALDKKNISARVSLTSSYQMAPAMMGGGADKSIAIGKEALNLLDQALITSPDNSIFQYWYGKVSAVTGLKLGRGEECLKKYLSHPAQPNEPSHAGANMRLGQIKEKQGNASEAKTYYELALKMNKDLKEAKDGLERVSK